MTNRRSPDIVYLTYMFSEEDGVGGIRSRSFEQAARTLGLKTIVLKNSGSPMRWLLKACLSIVRYRSSKYFYLSVGPFFPLLLIPILSFIFRVKLIVDFRDPLSQNQRAGYGNGIQKVSLKIKLSELIEQLTYFCCYELWVCTPGMKEYFSKLFKSEKKIHLVTNGYEYSLDDLKNITGKDLAKDSLKTYICIGKFAEYNYHLATKYIEEICRLNQNKDFKIILVGCDLQKNEELKLLFPDVIIEIIPRRPYVEVLCLAAQAHFGIVLIREESFDFGTKIFEYLGIQTIPFGLFDSKKNFYIYFKDFLSKDISTANFTKFDRKEIWTQEIKRLFIQQRK